MCRVQAVSRRELTNLLAHHEKRCKIYLGHVAVFLVMVEELAERVWDT
jgi:hypothetical protein